MKNIKSYKQFINESSLNEEIFGGPLNPSEKKEIIAKIIAHKGNEGYSRKELNEKSDLELFNILNELEGVDKVEEGFKDFIKKVAGQTIEWKLDGSYMTKASSDANSFMKSHPAAKEFIKSLISKGLNESEAKEATLRCYDKDIKSLRGYTVSFDTASKTLKLDVPKGTLHTATTG